MDLNLRAKNPDAVTDTEIQEWVYGQGLPSTIRNPQSDAFDKVTSSSKSWLSGEIMAADLPTKAWSTHEWLHFLNGLPTLTQEQFKTLDSTFKLTGTQNAETAFAWYMQAIKGGYTEAMPALEQFLMTVGRGKFLCCGQIRLSSHCPTSDHRYSCKIKHEGFLQCIELMDYRNL